MLALVCAFPAVHAASATTPDKAFHFGFKKSKNGEPANINQEGFKDILVQQHAIFLGDTTRKILYLTFDNGYENGYTTQVLDVLKTKKVPAAFFVTGQYIKDQPELLKRMVAEGHIIGNHSWSHPDVTTISDDRTKVELEKVKEAVTEITGQKEMKYLRPPRGIFSSHSIATANQLGYTSVFWSIAYKDWDTKDQKGASYAFQKVTSQFHPGAVILLHSVSKDNAGALAQIIDDARKKGYEFESLDQIKEKHY